MKTPLIVASLAYALTGTGAGTDLNMVKLDLESAAFADRNPELLFITGKTVTGVTAPGANQTFTLNWYFSDEDVSLASAASILAARKQSSGPKALTNAVNTTQQWELSGPILPQSRFLYVSVDKTGFASGASVALTLNVTRI